MKNLIIALSTIVILTAGVALAAGPAINTDTPVSAVQPAKTVRVIPLDRTEDAVPTPLIIPNLLPATADEIQAQKPVQERIIDKADRPTIVNVTEEVPVPAARPTIVTVTEEVLVPAARPTIVTVTEEVLVPAARPTIVKTTEDQPTPVARPATKAVAETYPLPQGRVPTPKQRPVADETENYKFKVSPDTRKLLDELKNETKNEHWCNNTKRTNVLEALWTGQDFKCADRDKRMVSRSEAIANQDILLCRVGSRNCPPM